MWIVRNPGGQHADELLDKGVITIGWKDTSGQLKDAKTPNDFYLTRIQLANA